MKTSIFLIAVAISVINASEKSSTNTTADSTKTKEAREKRNLSILGNYGASRRNDGYNYQPSGYNYEPNNYIGGGSAPASQDYASHYPEPPEPIIEIIIQDNNETLPAPYPNSISHGSGKRKKEQVQVFYVKYHKDEKSGLVIHDPVPALSPISHNQEEDDHEEEPIVVTPIPHLPQKTTTLRTIIRPDSQQYESNSGVHVTFGGPHNHHSKSDNQIHDEDKVESAIRPIVQLPQNRIGPVGLFKEKRSQNIQGQGRVVNGPPSTFHAHSQPSQQQLPHQRPHREFNSQNNFISQPNQGQLSHQLSLPNQDSSKPFHPNHSQQFQSQQRPLSIPVQHQHFGQQQQQNILGHQQFNQPPKRQPPAPQLPQPQALHQQPLLRPPQRPPVQANFNQNQRPFNYHAHGNQQSQNVRFPSQQPHFQGPHQQFIPNFQSQQHIQRPQSQSLPPRQGPPAQSFQSQNLQIPQINRPSPQFGSQPFSQSPAHQHFQQPPPNFRPNQEHKVQRLQPQPSPVQHQAQSFLQHNQQAQNHQHLQGDPNVFRGGLVEQAAPNLSNQHQHPVFPTQPKPQQEVAFRQEQNNFIQKNFGADVQVQNSVPKFEHHITETVNGPIFFQPTAVDMDQYKQQENLQSPDSQHRFAKSAVYDLPDEVPDDLREQLLSSGILENAQISILDYDKVGETSLQDLPQEHLANFFNAGGAAQIGASNKVISVLKPNGDSIDEKIRTLKKDKEITKLLDGVHKLPTKKEDVNLKVVRFDSQSQKDIIGHYIRKDSSVLPSVNLNQNNFNRYLPLKINGAQFPIPDVEELRGKKISSVVVLAPINGNDDESRNGRDTIDTNQVKLIAGDSLKTLLRKPSTENFRKWLEKEQKINADFQSVVLLVTKDSNTHEQEIYMYDITSKTVSQLNGELSSKFVDVAEENVFDDESSIAEQIDRIDEDIDDNDGDASENVETIETAPSNIVESVVKVDNTPPTSSESVDNKVLISSGYSVIKNE
ncbi:CLUMA_CG006307, isoform A [Clunio marinus]|uniref:CLUMA_CG006307, isoform A n=1 Tax=Clunio marinus TaxID=568069 RepID=A0A1J1HZ12_9DIPT|nr:CLUMA_CG006307, isoform A [Clunio marinus]